MRKLNMPDRTGKEIISAGLYFLFPAIKGPVKVLPTEKVHTFEL
jgi:hypothetical protein